jgi:hypothetical protein
MGNFFKPCMLGFMNTPAYTLRDWMPSVPPARDTLPWNVVVVYNDMHAALRAAHTVEQFGRKYGRRVKQQIHPVPVTYLDEPGYFDRTLAGALTADVIIISYSGPGGLPAVLKKWVEQCVAQKQPGDSTVVALLGAVDQADPPDSARYQFMRKAAHTAGLDFFAPSAELDGEEGTYDEPAFSQMEVVS